MASISSEKSIGDWKYISTVTYEEYPIIKVIERRFGDVFDLYKGKYGTMLIATSHLKDKKKEPYSMLDLMYLSCSEGQNGSQKHIDCLHRYARNSVIIGTDRKAWLEKFGIRNFTPKKSLLKPIGPHFSLKGYGEYIEKGKVTAFFEYIAYERDKTLSLFWFNTDIEAMIEDVEHNSKLSRLSERYGLHEFALQSKEGEKLVARWGWWHDIKESF